MSESSDVFTLNVYEEDLNKETTLDLSCQDLDSVPKLTNFNLVILYLQNNNIRALPDDFFINLKVLMYLDLRDNCLTELPTSVLNHQALTHLLLQNNCLKYLPNELGTISLKVLQIGGNPLVHPPNEVINSGMAKILTFLHDKYLEEVFENQSESEEEPVKDLKGIEITEDRSFNSVLDSDVSELQVKLNEKICKDPDEKYAKFYTKCRKLDKSRHRPLPPYCQSAKYLKPLKADGPKTREEKLKQAFLRDIALSKKQELLANTEKILQQRKNKDVLRNWRTKYRNDKFFANPSYKLDANTFPYDTNPEYMTLLNREDIEKDLPDKYRKNLRRRCRPSVPRKRQNDVHLALKIKKLFENLEAIDLNKDSMTPRTEQKFLLDEIQKITEIKQKLHELSTTNIGSV